MSPPEGTRNAWCLRTAALPGGRFELLGLLSDDYPDGAVVGPGIPPDLFPSEAVVLTVRVDALMTLR